jgi:hypothetical protein
MFRGRGEHLAGEDQQRALGVVAAVHKPALRAGEPCRDTSQRGAGANNISCRKQHKHARAPGMDKKLG